MAAPTATSRCFPRTTATCFLICLLVIDGRIQKSTAFSVSPTRTSSIRTAISPRCLLWSPTLAHPVQSLLPLYVTNKKDLEDPEDPDERELVRIRRRRRSSRYYDEDEEAAERGDDTETNDANYYDEEEEWDEDDDEWDEDDDDDLLKKVNYDYLFDDQVIPNPLLDSIDPDGAADRFPELARDPRFWLDMALFIAFLNFLSFVGPRDAFPDIPLY